MKDEIKEILDRLDFNEWEIDLYKVPITWSELYDIRDYITNLQEENERLRKNQKLTSEQRNHLHLELDEVLEIYKSRNEKAIELLNREYWINEHEHNDKVIDELLNILQGGDEE